MVFLFGLILFPISEFSYLHQIFGKLYLVRTSDFDIFEVDPEADNDIPSDLKKPQILEELKKYTPFKIKSSLLYKFYMSKTFCCCFKSCKSQNTKQIEKLFEHGQDHLESDLSIDRIVKSIKSLQILSNQSVLNKNQTQMIKYHKANVINLHSGSDKNENMIYEFLNDAHNKYDLSDIGSSQKSRSSKTGTPLEWIYKEKDQFNDIIQEYEDEQNMIKVKSKA